MVSPTSSGDSVKPVDAKKLRPSDGEVEAAPVDQTDDEYKAGRLRSLVQRLLGLTGKDLPSAILSLSDERISSLLDQINQATKEIFAQQSDTDAFLDDQILTIICDIPRSETAMEESEGRLSPMFDSIVDRVVGTQEDRVFTYLLGCYSRLEMELGNVWLEPYEAECLSRFKVRLLTQKLAFLRGFLTDGSTDVPSALLLRAMVMISLPDNYLSDLLTVAVETDETAVADAFNPVLDLITQAATRASLIDRNEDFRLPLRSLLDLCSVKIDNKRPICNLLVNRSDWLPTPVTTAAGRELTRVTFLGPFISLSLLPDDGDVEAPERFFEADDIPKESRQFVYSSMRNMLQSLRSDVHKVLHAILANADSREKAIEFLASIIKYNEKKSQLQADGSKLASDGFMLNFLAIMYELSAKVGLDKVHPLYPFHPECRVNVAQETKLKLSSEQYDAFIKTLDLSFERKFPTECFFLTMHAQHEAISAGLGNFSNLQRHISEVDRRYKLQEQEAENFGPDQQQQKVRAAAKLAQMLKLRSTLVKKQYCMEATLIDDGFLSRALQFCSKQLAILINAVNPD
uniref:Ubiquitin conjugation factor E4 core domain-containing protein n=1 Tax=Plectus sambesii TaxID=2011161 RepID=A0A914WVH2_9BILA